MLTRAEIWIGGPVPSRLIGQLCHEIIAATVYLGWNLLEPFKPEDAEALLRARSKPTLRLRLCSQVAWYGQFDGLESFLQANGIGYSRRSYYGMVGGMATAYRPGMPAPINIPLKDNGNSLVDMPPAVYPLDPFTVDDPVVGPAPQPIVIEIISGCRSVYGFDNRQKVLIVDWDEFDETSKTPTCAEYAVESPTHANDHLKDIIQKHLN